MLIQFIQVFTQNIGKGGYLNHQLKQELYRNIRASGYKTWLEKKLLRPRPRLTGAVTLLSLMTKLKEFQREDLFRVLWFIGSTQDDLIDSIPPGGDFQTIRREIFKTIFTNAPEYKELLRFFITNSETSFQKETHLHIMRLLQEWYIFLINQESRVLSGDIYLNWINCKQYREDQNGKIGRLLSTVLLGDNYSHFPQVIIGLPTISYLTQVIDDIADLPEDLANGRPSYAVGALNEHPKERIYLQRYIQKRDLGKVTPRQFQNQAPQSYALVYRQYQEYLAQIEYQWLQELLEQIFLWFPVYRDLMYRIDPRYANF